MIYSRTSPSEFYSKIRKGLGSLPCLAARTMVANSQQINETIVPLRYDWIKDHRFYDWINDTSDIDFADGQDWIYVILEIQQ